MVVWSFLPFVPVHTEYLTALVYVLYILTVKYQANIKRPLTIFHTTNNNEDTHYTVLAHFPLREGVIELTNCMKIETGDLHFFSAHSYFFFFFFPF